MPYFSPPVLFHEPCTLVAGETMTLRLCIPVHTGPADKDILKNLRKAFLPSKLWKQQWKRRLTLPHAALSEQGMDYAHEGNS